MYVEQDFFIGFQDVGEGNKLSNKSLLEALGNIGSLHCLKIGQITKDDVNGRFAWVVLDWKLEIAGRPMVFENYTVRTWTRSYTKAFAFRDYELIGPDGQVFGRATSRWTAVDLDSGSLVKLTPEIMEPFGMEERESLPGAKFPKMRTQADVLAQVTFKTSKAMVDVNRHVHNTTYLDLASEVLPSPLDARHFNSVDICYRKEISPCSTVSLDYMQDGDTSYVFVYSEDRETLHATMALS